MINRERILMPGFFLLPQLKKCPFLPKFVLKNPELNDPKKFGLFYNFGLFSVFSGFFGPFFGFFGYFRPLFGNVTFAEIIFHIKLNI